MKTINCSVIGTPSSRLFMYLYAMRNVGFLPAQIYLYGAKKAVSPGYGFCEKLHKKPEISFEELTENIPIINIEADDINSALEHVAEGADFYIFAGKGIVKEHHVSRFRILHIHPGLLPLYRGSTTIYYSLLNEGKAYATAFIMDKSIDGGCIVAAKEFEICGCSVDGSYDSRIRSELLADVLKEYDRNGSFSQTPQPQNKSMMFYKIHPVLKKIALNRQDQISNNNIR
ncbi:formyltransferase family protein [Seleniivibrio sp.]|uniref:formyltransferase family protein n=1 Tax=Seleniivibrio sp. TaxID=2898801 RepID=UPI0025FD67D8|nr:formyltransferase family protein [Seleniivibrio sp.]MCD8554297.1 hypothetical protein [Seleniivibrio sp.]